MISHQILGCLVLILLSQYGDASKSRYLVSIRNSLQRIEKLLVKQAEQPTFSCHVPENIFSLIWEISKFSNNDGNETQTQTSRRNLPPLDADSIRFFRSILGLDGEKDVESPLPGRHRNRNSNRNENINTNTNYFKARRTLDDSLNTGRNRNVNTNTNVNSNSNRHRELDSAIDQFDFSDEEEA